MLFTFEVGDWSGDGHEKSKKFVVSTNAPYDFNVKQALEKAFTELELPFESYQHFMQLSYCENYEDNKVPVEVFEKLGIDLNDVTDAGYELELWLEDDQVRVYEDDWVNMHLQALRITFPEYTFELVQPKNVTIGGYGLFY